MKKLIFIVLLFISIGVSAQNTVTLPAGTTSFTPAYRYKGTLSDSLKTFWMNFAGAPYNEWYSGTYINHYFLRIRDFQDSLAKDAIFFTTNFTGHGSFADPLNIADTLTKTRLVINSAHLYLPLLPDTATGYKALVVDVNGKLQRAPYGSGGSAIHAAGGLHLHGDTVKLGGILNQDTVINHTGHELQFVNNSSSGDFYAAQNALHVGSDLFMRSVGSQMDTFSQDSTGVAHVTTSGDGSVFSATMEVDNNASNSKQISLSTIDSGIVIKDDITHIGLKGDALFPVSGDPKQYLQAGNVTGGGTTTNSLTFNNSGTGDASGSTFNGSASKTLSYNSIGAVSPSSTATFTNKSGNISQWTNDSGYATQAYVDAQGSDGIVSGMVTTTVTTTATTTAGTYRLNNTLYVLSSSTNTTIPAQDATNNLYVLIVGNTSGALSAVTGTPAIDAVEPDLPANNALIASIYIPATGGTVTSTGGGKAGNSVTQVTSANADILVTNPKTTPLLTLNKINGHSIAFFDITSSLTSLLSGKQASLGFTPENVANKATSFGTVNNTLYPSTQAVSNYVTGLGYVTPSSIIAFTNKDLTSGTNTFPTFNQNTTGSAAKWTTARNLAGNSVDGSADVAFTNKFIAQGTTDAGLSGAQFLGALATGIVKNTTTTGILSIAAAGTDYQAPITLTTTGTGGAATFSGGTLNIPQYTGGSGGGSYVGDETPSGVINSSNTSFVVSHTPLTGSLSIYYNGQRLISGTDYTLSGTTYTTLFTPLTGSTLKETYTY